MIKNQLTNTDILIVDDIPDNIRLLSDILTKQGYQVRKSLNGKMALKAIAASIPDLLLLDINMPEMNGYQLCKQLKLDPKTKGIPIIFISGISETLDKVKAFNCGGVDYITKPFQIEEVLVRINNQLTIQRQQKKLTAQNYALKQEIDRRKQAEASLLLANQELERLAIIDSLTKVANRHRFDQYLEQEWSRMSRRKSPLSLILCDIDYFKFYNDTYGHQAGDNCLFQVAQALVFCAKRSTDLLARYGGEEFAMILPDTSRQGAVQVAKSMCLAIEKAQIKHEASQVSKYVTISAGVSSCIPDQNSSIKDLIKKADEALYQSKQKGRNQVNIVAVESRISNTALII